MNFLSSITRIKILVTGSAGFIGSALVKSLLQSYDNLDIVGVDNCNDYYDVSLKEERLSNLNEIVSKSTHLFFKLDISDKPGVEQLFQQFKFDIVVNLAAQAGVRYSLINPDAYIASNLVGFFNVLDCSQKHGIKHFIYASSSSVYGMQEKVPFATTDPVDTPESLYAATKKSDELIAYSYSKMYNLPTTGLRFFTVYGPMGRPDMAYFKFAKKLVKGEKIDIYNYGNCKRDFTYIDDIIKGIINVIEGSDSKFKSMLEENKTPYKIYNIGNSKPENLLDFVNILSEELISAGVLRKDFNIKEHLNLVPMQVGDVLTTFADTSDLERDFGFKPTTTLKDGLKNFCKWFFEYINK